MQSRTQVKVRLKRKTNPELAETISLALKHKPWLSVAYALSGPTRLHSSVSLQKIDSEAKVGDTVLILGKVLSQGVLSKKLVVCALSISQAARAKLKESKSEFISIAEEIKKNPKAEGLKVLK